MARTANTAAAAVVAAPAAYSSNPVNIAGKYANAPRAVASKGITFTLTTHGASVAAANGAGKGGKVTVMGLVAVAAAHAAKRNGGTATGLQIVAAMRALPAVTAAYAATKAGQYAPKGSLPCPAWCNGYVQGAARASHGLLAKA